MKTYLDCYPCFLRQALSAARRASATEDQQRQILISTMDELQRLPADATPPVMADQIHRSVRRLTHTSDPYREAKQQATRQALALFPDLLERVAQSADPLQTALRMAIAGNIIDLGVAESYDLEASLNRVLLEPLAIDDLEPFRDALSQSRSILYLADNAGETVFDRVLIQTLQRPVTYVVKASAIINDATREDAVAAGIDGLAEIIDNGTDAPGTLLERCSDDFHQRFDQAELIIAKGQANFESLSNTSAPLFFLLQAKCHVIAQKLGVDLGGIILKRA